MSTKALDRTLEAWRKENVNEVLSRLIRQANFDLYYGPVCDGAYGDPAESDPDEWGDYPGFVTATKRIRAELESIPRELFIDVDCEAWQESEPESEKCETCDGQGCGECNRLGCFEPSGDWYRLDRREIVETVCGKELASYV